MASAAPSASNIANLCAALNLGDEDEFKELVLSETVSIEIPKFHKWTLVG